jgi:hypothetical protein
MIGLALIALLVVVAAVLAGLCPVLGACWVFFALWRLPSTEARAREVHEQLRHERARREIDRIAFETSRAMYAAVSINSDVTWGTEAIEGTATELEVRR